MRYVRTLIWPVLLIALSCASPETREQKTYSPNWESLSTHQVPDWFMDGKFGIYFHWGVYSVPAFGNEWYPRWMYVEGREGWGNEIRPHHVETYGADFQYHQFIPDFTAEHFDAEEWAALFKASGAAWAGPVTEHCDNFSMWDSEVNSWNAADMGPKRDIVGELEKAIKAQGLKFTTTFHHQWHWAWYPVWNGLVDTSTVELREFYGEWTSPETFDNYGKDPDNYGPSEAFVERWKAKVVEVIDAYEPHMLWFDSRLSSIPEETRLELLAYFYNQAVQADRPVVVNYKNKDLAKGAGVIDIERGRMEEKVDYPWLTDDSWDWSGWAYKEPHDFKSANHVLDGLIDIVSKNGCLLLNIVPRADGVIPDEVRNGLLEMGSWLSAFGDAIYGTRPFLTSGEGPTTLVKGHFGGVTDKGISYGPEDFRFTTKGRNLYIIQLAPPVPGKDYLLATFAESGPASDVHIKSVKMLDTGKKVSWELSTDGLRLSAPEAEYDPKAVVYQVRLK